MGLRLVSGRPKFRHKVTAKVPVDGGYRDETFHVRYQLAADHDAALVSTAERNDFLRDVVVEIEDLVDETGAPLTWNDDVRDAALALPWARFAILRGYFAAVTEGAAGN